MPIKPYDHTTYPANGALGSSSAMRNELSTIEAGFDMVATELDTKALATDLTAHLADTTDAHDATAISTVPSGNLTSTNVGAALNELQTDVNTRATTTALTAHTGAATGAHAATAISNVPSGNLSATTVQAAVNELDNEKAGLATANAFTNTNSITVNSASPALTVTQTGAGNALVVEDSASTDSSPFVIDNDGNLIAGLTTNNTVASSRYLYQAVSNQKLGLSSIYYNANTLGSAISLAKSKSSSTGTNALVGINDILGTVNFAGADGTDFVNGASISAAVDGTPGTNVMPGRIVLSTTADGASSPTERMRIDSAGRIGIGGNTASEIDVFLRSNATGSNNKAGISNRQTILSDVTGSFNSFASFPVTQAASFTLTNLRHFEASQQTFGAGSTVTNQFGYLVQNNLTGATNNYGFYGNIPSGTGRWNFYANGTAPNYFAGDIRTNTVLSKATTVSSSNTGAIASASSLLGGIRTGIPVANINLQMPTGTNMDAAFQDLQTNQAIEWSLINLAAATHIITVTAGADHTLVGNMQVQANSSGRFATRKTATNTFITYRLG